jgi:formylglycine-generating enzyme required for sulfatase activity
MGVVISVKGINQAIANLNYQNEKTLKYTLVHAITRLYEDESSVESVQGVGTEELVKALWDTGDDPTIIKGKRKNLSSIKSSVNADLRRLYEEGKNPEGITIGRNNIFVMADEAKDKLLEGLSVAEASTLEKIAESLNVIKVVLSSPEALADAVSSDGSIKLEELRSTIQGLAEKLGLGGREGGLLVQASEGGQGPESLEDDAKLAEDAETSAEGVEDEGEREEIIKVPPEIVDEDEFVEEAAPEEEEEIEEIEEDEIEEGLEEDEAEVDLEESEVEEDLENIETEEEVEDEHEAEIVDSVVEDEAGEKAAEPEEPEEEIEIEEVEEDEVIEKLELTEDEKDLERAGAPEGLEEVEVSRGTGQGGATLGHLEDDHLGDIAQEEDYIQQDRLLAEEFHNYLGDTDRFYNQYLLIPAGIYIIGSKEPNKNEQPERKVHLPRFYVGRFPVTNALFEIFVEKTGYRTTSERLGYSTVYHGRFRDTVDEKTGLVRCTCHAAIGCKTIQGACWHQPEGPGSTIHEKRNHPVVHVSVEDAMAFAAWTGKRLPTEDEWESAARNANGHAFPWGNDWKSGSCNIEESAIADTTPVDKYTEFASDLGMVDAIGNVLEWTLDTCEPPSHVKNNSTYHIVKGGSWISGNDIRLYGRFKWNAESPSNNLGFRCIAI